MHGREKKNIKVALVALTVALAADHPSLISTFDPSPLTLDKNKQRMGQEIEKKRRKEIKSRLIEHE